MSDDKKREASEEGEKTIAGLTTIEATGCIGHLLHPNSPNCPKCGAPPSEQELRNYDRMWGEGDLYCKKCGTYVRGFDSG